MKWPWLLLLIPLSQAMAATAPTCRELPGLLEGFEKDLMDASSLQMCERPLEEFSLLTYNDGAGVNQIMSAEQAAFAYENRCMKLSVIENDIRRLENQHTLLLGFEKLKADIKAQKELVASRNATTSGRAALHFQDAVITAQSIELLVNTGTVARDLKAALAAATPPVNFTTVLASVCSQRTDAQPDARDACNTNVFKPTPAAIEELTYLLGSATLDQAQVDQWKSSLQIVQADGSAYSFDQMRSQMDGGLAISSDNRPGFSKQELMVIQSLPDFKNDSALEVVNTLNDSRKNVVLKQQFQFLVEDLLKRQQYDIQSKLSLTASQYAGDFVSDTDREKCNDIKSDHTVTTQCIEALRAAYNSMEIGVDQAHLANILDSVEAASIYAQQITDTAPDCLEATTTAVDALNDDVSCPALITGNQAELQNKILALTVIKDKILSEKSRTLQLRNFTAETLEQQCASSVEESDVGLCDENFEPLISQSANQLLSDAMAISVVYARPAEATLIDNICHDGSPQTSAVKSLCMVGQTPAIEEEELAAPVDSALDLTPHNPPADTSMVSEAWKMGLSNLAQNVANGYRA